MKSNFHKLSFRDVMCGFVNLGGISRENEKSFEQALSEFSFDPQVRSLKKQTTLKSVVYVNSFIEDRSVSSSHEAFFVGYASGLSNLQEQKRDLARVFAENTDWQASDFNQFIDSRFCGIVVDHRQNQVRLVSDYFGKRKLFYKVVGSVLYFSTEVQVLAQVEDSDEKLDRQALRSFLSLGTPVGDRTLSTKIKSIPLQSFIEWDGSKIRRRKLQKRSSDPVGPQLDPQKIYQSFQTVAKFLSEDLGFHISDLTGGADSRFTLKALHSLEKSITYTCENQDLENNPPYHYDYKVMEILRDKFALQIQFDFDQHRSSRKFLKNAFEIHRHFEGDMYDNAFSSMFGGELMGGWGYDNFFSENKKNIYRQFDQEALKRFPIDYFDETRCFETELALEAQSLDYRDPAALLSVALLYGSPSYFRDNLRGWFESYQLSSRKISAFLGDAVLRSLDVPNLGAQLSGYQFYLKLYKQCAPEMLEIPFHSGFTREFPEELTDIRDQIDLVSKHKNSTAGEASVSSKSQSTLDVKIALLKEYFNAIKGFSDFSL